LRSDNDFILASLSYKRLSKERDVEIDRNSNNPPTYGVFFSHTDVQ